MTEPTGHLDTFCRDSLPPRELWPDLLDLPYPPRLNCAAELLDARAGEEDRTAILWPGGRWTYRELASAVNRIARVLVEDLGLIAGNRVLLRSPNTPMLAACWLAVVKAGGVAVCTMPLLRRRELAHIADKARSASPSPTPGSPRNARRRWAKPWEELRGSSISRQTRKARSNR